MPEIDFSKDVDVWDGVENVTYEVTRGTPGHTVGRSPHVEYVPIAKRRLLTFRELATSGGAYTNQDRAWLVPAKGGLVASPKPGDVVRDNDGVTWTVLSADLGKQGNTWKLTCRNLVLAHDLHDLITIETPEPKIVKDKSGAPVRNWTVKYANLKARVQPIESTVVDERGVRGFKTTHTVIVSQQVSVTNEDRIVFGGRYYEIRAYKNAERIDQLPEIDAELVP